MDEKNNNLSSLEEARGKKSIQKAIEAMEQGSPVLPVSQVLLAERKVKEAVKNAKTKKE